MSNFISKLLSPTALLYTYVILMQIPHGIYLAGQTEPPPGYTLMDFVGHLWILGWWLLMDSRKRGVALVYDIGFFLSIAWPFIMLYYLFKTRGVTALLPIFAFVAANIAAVAVGMGVYLLLAPPPS